MNIPKLFYRLSFRSEKQMKKFLLVTIIGFVLAALAAIGAPQPLASPAIIAQTECSCSNLKVLQIELRNALRLQQAFSNKIPELRKENVSTSKNMLQIFAKGDARRGLEPITDYKGPSEFDYVSWGDTQDPDQSYRYTKEKLCAIDKSANDLLEAAKQASACAGIAVALEAHEKWHVSFCLSIGYRPYLTMHGADRAQEEVEAYGEQIKVLRAEIAKVLKKNCKGYSASGKMGTTVFSGDICDLEKPFTIKTNNQFLTSFEFVPSSPTKGTWSFSTKNGVVGGGGGEYTITGTDTEKTGIELNGSSSAYGQGPRTRTPTLSGSGPIHIDLVPLDKECGGK
jgi:hypothetical protein